jgi:hypothetical protein
MWVVILIGGALIFLLGVYIGKQGRAADTSSQSRPDRAFLDEQVPDDERDSWEGAFWEAPEPRDLATTVEIEYRDGGGSKSKRVIHTRSFDNRLHNGLLIGHCTLRNATRTFRFDRVLSAVDVATGEVISDLRSHLNTLYESFPERSRDSLEERFRDLLRVLLFVAKADGQYRREEKIIVRDFCRELASDPRVTDEMIDRLFDGLDVPSLHSFKVAVGKVLDQQLCSPKQLERICLAIVETQGSRTPGEIEALEYVSQRIARHARATGSAA